MSFFSSRRGSGRTLSLRTRLVALVALAAVPAAIVGVLGVIGMQSLEANVSGMDHRVARPLSALGDLRDMEGDTRVEVLQYVHPNAVDRGSLRNDISDTDNSLQDAAESYLKAHGSTTDGQARLLKQFLALHATWISVRARAFDAADSGDTNAAYAIVRGELADANEAMAAPLDTLMSNESHSADAFRAEAKSSYRRIVIELVVVLLVGLAAALALAFWQANRIVRVVNVVRDGLARLARRDLTWVAPEARGTDELSSMTRDAGRAMDTMRGIVDDLRSSAGALTSSGTSLSSVSGQLTGTATESSTQAGYAAAAAEQVSRNVDTVAAGTEEMSASIREIARSASAAATVAGDAVTAAGEATATVTKLGDSSSEIGNVIKVISSIAEQTNLLALNATIEAARAGEAGRGFAVVANEVKELAQETARATDDITERIEAIQTDASAAVEAIGVISQIIGQIHDAQTTIASAVEEQTATTNEMARNVADAATGSAEIAGNITRVAEAAGETNAGAGSTAAAASDLVQMATALERLVSEFETASAV